MKKSLYELLFESEQLNEMARGRSAAKTYGKLLSAGGRADVVDSVLNMHIELPTLKSDQVISVLRRTGAIQESEMDSETLSPGYVREILRNQPIMLGATALGMLSQSELESATYRGLSGYSTFADSAPLSGTLNVLKNPETYLEIDVPLSHKFLKPINVSNVKLKLQDLTLQTWSGDGVKTYSSIGDLPVIDVVAALGSIYQVRAYEIMKDLYEQAVSVITEGRKTDILSNIAQKRYRIDIIKHIERILGQQVDEEWEGHTADFSLLNMKGMQPGIDAMASLAVQFSDIYGEPDSATEELVRDFYRDNPSYFAKLVSQAERLMDKLGITPPKKVLDRIMLGDVDSIIPFLRALGNETAKSDHLEHLTYKYRFQLMFEIAKELVAKEVENFNTLAAMSDRVSWGNRKNDPLYAAGITWALGQALSGEPIESLAAGAGNVLRYRGAFGAPEVSDASVEGITPEDSPEPPEPRREGKYRLEHILFREG